MAIIEPTTTTEDQIVYSNTSIVRDPDGKLNLFVGSEEVIGVVNITCQNGEFWGFAIPVARVKLCERVPAQPVYEHNNNVVPLFPVKGSAGDVPPLGTSA